MENKVSIRRGLQNHFFALSMIYKACPRLVFWKIVSAALQAGIYAVNLYFLRYAVNNIQLGGSFQISAFYLLVICFCTILYRIFYMHMENRIVPRYNYQVQSYLKTITLRKTAACELACYENPDFYNRYTLAMAGCSERFNTVLDCTCGFFSSITTLITSGLLALLIDPLVLLFSILPFALVYIREKRSNIGHETSKKISEINRRKNYTIRTFYQNTYAKEMHMTGISSPLLVRFETAMNEALKVYKTYGLKSAVLWILETVTNSIFSEYLVLFYAAWQTLVTGSMQYGDCLVLVNTLESVYDAIHTFMENWSASREHAIYLEDVRYFWDYQPEIIDDDDLHEAVNGEIVFHDVSFRYAGASTDTLKHINLYVKKGEKIAIVGPNGAGKTTLLKLMLRLYDPTDGKITINGSELKKLRLKSVRKLFSTVLQDYKHFSMSVIENVCMNESADEAQVVQALQKSGLYERIICEPNGILSILDREFDENGLLLSGGELQKLAIAHTYIKNSPIVILDEPSSALDPIAEHELYHQMMESGHNKTVIFISHRMSSVSMADTIWYMENGEIIEKGCHKELMQKNGRYAEMYKAQAESYQEATV